jgi:hypothetical protein
MKMPDQVMGRHRKSQAFALDHSINQAFRLSPRDHFAPMWMVWVGLAKEG